MMLKGNHPAVVHENIKTLIGMGHEIGRATAMAHQHAMDNPHGEMMDSEAPGHMPMDTEGHVDMAQEAMPMKPKGVKPKMTGEPHTMPMKPPADTKKPSDKPADKKKGTK